MHFGCLICRAVNEGLRSGGEGLFKQNMGDTAVMDFRLLYDYRI
jgi:hypothetical protein